MRKKIFFLFIIVNFSIFCENISEPNSDVVLDKKVDNKGTKIVSEKKIDNFGVKTVSGGDTYSGYANDDEYFDYGIDQGVTIFGVKKGTSSFKTIEKKDIEKNNLQSFGELLKKHFNFTITNYGGAFSLATVSIRGLSGSRVLFLINGVPVNSSQSGDFDLSQIDINSIEKIEVLEGGGQNEFGYKNGMGGVINIITKSDKKEKSFFINVTGYNKFYYPDFYYTGMANVIKEKKFSEWYDFFDTQNFSFSVGGTGEYKSKLNKNEMNEIENKNWNIKYSANVKRSNNNFIYEDSYNYKRRRTDLEGFDINNSFDFSIELPSYSKLYFSDYNYFANKNVAGSILSISNGKQLDLRNLFTIGYDIDRFFSDNIDSEFILSHNFNFLNYVDNYGDDSHYLNSVIFVNRWGFIINRYVTFKPYYDINFDYIHSTKIKDNLQITTNFGLNFLFKIEKLLFITDVKILYQNNLSYPIPIPKIGLQYQINDLFSFKTNIFRLFRTPTFNDLYWKEDSFAKGNPDLKSEDGVGGDFIFDYKNPKYFDFSNVIYWNYITDGIIWQNNGGKWMPENIGKVAIFGYSTSLKSNFSKIVYFSINYDFSLSFVLYNNFTIFDNKRLPYKPEHTLGINLTGDWKTGNATLSVNYQSPVWTGILNVSKLKEIFTVDLDINQSIKILTFFISFKNIFNYFYYQIDNYPSPNGSVTIGFKINYRKNFN